jgi:regulator of RNase E activity RraA
MELGSKQRAGVRNGCTILPVFEVKKEMSVPMINATIQRPPKRIIEGFQRLLEYDSVTCAISDCMGHVNAMTSDMKPLFEGIRLVGTAVTVKTLASDLAVAFKAIDLCQAGDVMVIDSQGSVNTAFWGENMTMSAINRGVVAAVIDGACRDVEEIRKMRFPVICKGIVPNIGSFSGYGDVNVPVQCAGWRSYPVTSLL